MYIWLKIEHRILNRIAGGEHQTLRGGYSGIANDNNWPKQYHNFSGGMSQIYVYSEALSDEKMKALYNETKWRYQ